MNRRSFLRSAAILGAGYGAAAEIYRAGHPTRLVAAAQRLKPANPDWADPRFKTKVQASSYVEDPPWGYLPGNVFGDRFLRGWRADNQAQGAWLEINFSQQRPVSEIWILTQPIPPDIVGESVYSTLHPRAAQYAPPRRVQIRFSNGFAMNADLRQADFFQIVSLTEPQTTALLRIVVEDVWEKPGRLETGIAKLRVFPLPHERTFEIDAYEMYDVHDGQPVQTATLHFINPGGQLTDARLVISHKGNTAKEISLTQIPERAVSRQRILIPAPYQDTVMDFEIPASSLGTGRSLRVPAYHSYFDGGTFALNCTCHNDLGWLDTQKKTADYRSADIILPALQLLREYPEFCYSMESTTYLMEFLQRHPDLQDEMTGVMRERRFMWGASYVQCLEAHVGPENLARQFYFGRRWLQKKFPGVDTRFYVKTDPAGLTLQMPQILARAGIKYLVQGRFPYGYYRWEAPDGSFVFTYAYQYADPIPLLDPKGNHGWLFYAQERKYFYAPRHLPRTFCYDYTSDYLPPQLALPPYVREQNEAMKRFGRNWNEHNRSRQIHPPEMKFVTPEEFLDEFTRHSLDLATLKGDWPLNWAYYDEPGHREGLLAGREAHNRLLAAERLFAGLSLTSGFQDYPQQTFTEAWMANCWPDHGWGGNRGTVTDGVYVASYEKSKRLANQLLNEAGSRLIKRIPKRSAGLQHGNAGFKDGATSEIPLAVFNPLSWERTDVVRCHFQKPAGRHAFVLRDASGREVPYEILDSPGNGLSTEIVFVAEAVPSLGYCTYSLEPSSVSPPVIPLTGKKIENDFFKMAFGSGGIKSLYDKKLKWEVLRTEKFDGGEVIQFTAPGYAWDRAENVTMEHFDKTSNHAFPLKSVSRGPVRVTARREASFKHFILREHFCIYHLLPRVEVDLEIMNWDGQKRRELRAVFPINLDDARIAYEVQFGKVELGKDELDFTLLPRDPYSAFNPDFYGGDHPLPFREAINWIDASSRNYLGHGCLSASDITLHLFRDETPNPAPYPLLQHVLLSTRKSQGWNPVYWFTQKGTHRYRTALLPHQGDWRLRYREAIGFNYPLVAFVGAGAVPASPSATAFFCLEPANLVLTALKKSEDDDRLVLRFYEAEGFETPARIRFASPIKRAWRANLIEDDESPLEPLADGSLQIAVKPWEIVTLKTAF